MKKFLSVLIVSALVLGMFAVNVSADTPISIIVDGKPIETDVAPYLDNNRVMVPVRAIFEALGATVEWNNETNTAIAKKEAQTLYITADSDTLTRNNSMYALDVPAKVVNDRLFVPVRAVSEALDCKVDWNDETKTVTITPVVLPVEYTYVTETVVRPTRDENIKITFNYTYPKITSGKDFLEDDVVERINELAKDVTYDAIDAGDYAFKYTRDWSNLYRDIYGEDITTKDIVTTLYMSEKYNTVSLLTETNEAYTGDEIYSITVSADWCDKKYGICDALNYPENLSTEKIAQDMFDVFANNFEDVRYGLDDLCEIYNPIYAFTVSDDRVSVFMIQKYLLGVGKYIRYYTAVKSY